jgi:hypothetical protein
MDLTKSAADGWRIRSRKSCNPSDMSEFSISLQISVSIVYLLILLQLIFFNSMKRLQFAFEEEDQEKVLSVCLRMRERVALIEFTSG